MKFAAVLLVALPMIMAESLLLLDLSPEEAQKYIDGSSSVLNYAKNLGEGPLPDKTNYYRGKAIENPGEFIQRNYLANQFHGQNGLGKAKFGYSDWNQARVEDIDVHGKTHGSYRYVDPNGENVEVSYYADTQGFHQTDNRPVVKIEPVTDTPEVKAAIAAHQKAWSEAAAANKVSSAFPKSSGAGDSAVGSGSEAQYAYKPYVHEEPTYDGPTGPPRGFYYNFDYEVPLIVKNGAERK